jgi:putative ABC transport system permease protein
MRFLIHFTFQDATRFLTTVSGVAFSVMLVLVQVGIFLGMLETASITVDRMDADLWVTARNTANIDFANTFPDSHVQKVRSIPGVARADNLIVWFVTVALPSGSKESALVYALEDFSAWSYPWRVVEGNPRDLRRGRYVFLDESSTRRFGPFSIGEYREFLGLRLKIIGITAEARSFTTNPIAFVDYRVAQSLLPQELRNRTTYMIVKLAHGANLSSVPEEVRRRLPHNDVRTREEWSGRCRNYWIVNTGLGLSMYVTVFLGCVIGVVVVAQTLYTATIDHYQEFAIIKSLGGGNFDIYRILAFQAMVASVLGFALGVALACAVRPLLARLELKLILEPDHAAEIFVANLILCLAASLLSYRRIALLDPATVFRS